jgi:ferric-dicitrate binding protein FerR (iron transport regulator)
MNEDYLWDRSGEPDPAVRELEEVLGSLRYQPKPLRLPATSQIGRPRRRTTWLAVAAAVAFLVLAVGVWVRVKRSAPSVHPQVAENTEPEVEN